MLLALPDEGEPHEYEVILSLFMTPCPDLQDTSFTNTDLILLVNGSYCRNEKGYFQLLPTVSIFIPSHSYNYLKTSLVNSPEFLSLI